MVRARREARYAQGDGRRGRTAARSAARHEAAVAVGRSRQAEHRRCRQPHCFQVIGALSATRAQVGALWGVRRSS